MAAFVVGSNLTAAITRRFRPADVMVGGTLLAALGLVMLTQVSGSHGLALLVTGQTLYSLGLSPIFTLTNDVIIGNAPPERAGSAAAISETGSELGGALGIAILGSIGTAIYRTRVADVAPAGLPFDAIEAARNTLAGAVAAAEGLPVTRPRRCSCPRGRRSRSRSSSTPGSRPSWSWRWRSGSRPSWDARPAGRRARPSGSWFPRLPDPAGRAREPYPARRRACSPDNATGPCHQDSRRDRPLARGAQPPRTGLRAPAHRQANAT